MSYVATAGVVDKIAGAITATKTILDDPALPQLTKYVAELHTLEVKRAGPNAPAPKGIGLSEIVTPVRYFVYYKKNRWVLPVAVLALLGIPLLVGYSVGKKRRA